MRLPPDRCRPPAARAEPDLSGDIGHRIFQHPFSWASLGVGVRRRSQTLKVCYRTLQQIRRPADQLSPTVLRDSDGLEDERRGIISVFDGPAPVVKACCSNMQTQRALRYGRDGLHLFSRHDDARLGVICSMTADQIRRRLDAEPRRVESRQEEQD